MEGLNSTIIEDERHEIGLTRSEQHSNSPLNFFSQGKQVCIQDYSNCRVLLHGFHV
jgi:hypothetical protein